VSAGRKKAPQAVGDKAAAEKRKSHWLGSERLLHEVAGTLLAATAPRPRPSLLSWGRGRGPNTGPCEKGQDDNRGIAVVFRFGVMIGRSSFAPF
jgi:hypothetical protein